MKSNDCSKVFSQDIGISSMKFLAVILCAVFFSVGSYGFSSGRCSDQQVQASQNLSFVPGAVVAFDVAAVATSQVMWVTSQKNGDKNRDDDMTLVWLMPSLVFDLIPLTAFPACNSIVEKDGQILTGETERKIKTNLRIASGMSLMGQYFSLTNTIDEDKRQITRTLMMTTLLNQVLFEWLWTYNVRPQSVAMIQPYLNQDAQGLQFVYRF